ncbi:MAG TPA: DUF6777 domain-containing protein [Acidimicrobiales bacterium]|nr:DUF6777 domain-containing protein [Acidimicrobiales bacterium]
MGALLLVAGIVIAVVVVNGDDGGDEVAEEVFLEPISSARDPFTTPVGQDETVPTTTGTAAGRAIASTSGGEPGLYGGTQREGACDTEQLATFLQDNPAKARAWATVLGITPAEIPSFIDRLTPVVLRSDTRVTNHGFRDGRAVASQAVLQAGTAVLVDDRGQPVTKCYCGNPLTAPRAVPQRYTGPRWAGFSEGGLTVVVEHTTVIETFVLVDITTGETFSRPVGTSGDDDGPAQPPPATTTTTTAPPATTAAPGTTEPPDTTAPPGGGDEVEGSYTYHATIAEGSSGNCTAYDGTFEVTVDGSGDDRTVRFDAGSGGVLEGPLGPDDSFDLSAPLPSGSGTQTLTGSFTVAGGTISISGSGTVDGGGVLCNLTFTGERFP